MTTFQGGDFFVHFLLVKVSGNPVKRDLGLTRVLLAVESKMDENTYPKELEEECVESIEWEAYHAIQRDNLVQ